MKSYRLIIFDLDDTLFDYTETERSAVIEACESFGVALAGDLYSKYKMANDIVRGQYPKITPDNIQRFRFARAAKFLALINRSEVAPEDFVEQYLDRSTVGILISGVQETLEALEGIPKVVATNGSNYPRRNKLESSTIAKHFCGFFSAENLGVAKSHPAYFLKIIQHCDVPKEHVLIVGDDYRLDIENAINIGVDCCWFNYRKKRLDGIVPDTVTVIERFGDLVGLVTGGAHEEKH
jgi:HAD superfamily hydrolase (TIGR01549 family)